MEHLDVVVLGAGFSGLGAAMKLARAGRRSFVVLEQADDVGGTWWQNTYPGVECDVPSQLYSYSFAPNPDWSKTYGTGAEIQAYLRSCAESSGVLDRIRFSTRAESARWTGEHWVVRTSAGDEFSSRYLISALGGLSAPNIPGIPGLDTFDGPVFHTARWRHDVDLAGKAVAVIGTGASAVQAAPRVAQVAGRLSLFQRTPIWAIHKRDEVIPEQERRRLAADPGALLEQRWTLWRQYESSGVEAMHEGTAVNRAMERAALRNIVDHVRDPGLVAKLTPTFNITCKRPTYTNEYYPMFNRPNVDLVTDPIREVTPQGIVTSAGLVPLDVLVLATGFKPFDLTKQLEVFGTDGLSLADAWSKRVTSYRSVMMRGFPNLFLVFGPNSAGLGSAVQMIEAAGDFALDAMAYVESVGCRALDPRQGEVDAFTEFVDRVTAGTSVSGGCDSWWTENGQTHSLWPLSSVEYRKLLAPFDGSHFEILEAAR